MIDAGTRSPATSRASSFLAGPFSGKSWRATLDTLLSLPVGIGSFTYVVVMMTFGIATIITPLGLPVIAAAVAGARGWGSMERVRAEAFLDTQVQSPKSLNPHAPGFFGWFTAAISDGPGWRALLYLFLLFPLGVTSFVISVTLWVTAAGAITYPLWYTFPPEQIPLWYPYYDFGTFGGSFIVAGAGIVLLFITPWLVRGLAAVRRAMARGLLGRLSEGR